MKRPKALGRHGLPTRSSEDYKSPGLKPVQRIDAVAVLTAYFLFTIIVPAGSIIAPLGSLGAPSTLVAVLVLVWWIWDLFHRRTPGQQRVQPVRRAAVVMIVVALIVNRHAWLQPLPADEITPSDTSLVRFLALMGVILVGTDGAPHVERWQVLLRRMSQAAAAVSALALLQFFTRQLWIDMISIPGLTPPAAGGLLVRSGFSRPSGTSTHPIEFGAVLGMMFPLAINRARIARTDRKLAWAAVAVIGLAVLVSVSRTALVCAALGTLLLLPTWPRITRVLGLLAGFGLTAAAAIAVPGLIGTLRGLFSGAGQDSSVLSRATGYAYAQEMFGYNPWLGRGLGTYLPKYYIFDNGYLGLAMEAGVIGVIGFVTLVVTGAIAAACAARSFTRFEDRQMAWALFASVVSGAVAMGFFDIFAFPQSAACLALVVGLSGAAYRLAREPASQTDEFNSSPGGSLGIIR